HGAPEREIVRMIAGSRDVPVWRAEAGDDEEIGAVAHEFVDDVAAMQKRIRIGGHFRGSSLKVLAPSTRWPIRTATGFQGLKARFAAPCTVEATRSGSSTLLTITPMASSEGRVPCPIGICHGLNSPQSPRMVTIINSGMWQMTGSDSMLMQLPTPLDCSN